MDILCKVTPYGLVPMYGSDLEARKRLKEGSTVRCNVRVPRNYGFHKKFFALVRLTYDNLPEPLVNRWNIRSIDDMVRRFKYDLGYFTSRTNAQGEREIEYLSISFAAMEQRDFEDFYNRCIGLVMHRYIRGIGREDIISELENFM